MERQLLMGTLEVFGLLVKFLGSVCETFNLF